MQHMKIVKVPEQTKQVVDFKTCDLCQERLGMPKYSGDQLDSVSIQAEKWTGYAECGDYQKTAFDMCMKCFEEKLIPWLASQGATSPRIETSDW